MTVKNLRHIKIHSVNPLSHIIDRTNEYIEESNRNKYLKQLADERKNILENYGLWTIF